MGARLGEVLKRHYEIISYHRIAVKIKKPEDIRFLKAFFWREHVGIEPNKIVSQYFRCSCKRCIYAVSPCFF